MLQFCGRAPGRAPSLLCPDVPGPAGPGVQKSKELSHLRVDSVWGLTLRSLKEYFPMSSLLVFLGNLEKPILGPHPKSLEQLDFFFK